MVEPTQRFEFVGVAGYQTFFFRGFKKLFYFAEETVFTISSRRSYLLGKYAENCIKANGHKPTINNSYLVKSSVVY